MKLRDRVKELRRVKASDILPDPRNWRTHPTAQQDALRGLLAEVGIAGALIGRDTPAGLMLIDGHLRADVSPETEWPVLVLDVDEVEAGKLLATLDPLADMAEPEPAKLDALLREVETGSQELAAMLEKLADDAGLYKGQQDVVEDEVPEPPAEPVTKPGDLWLLGEHRLLCGDSTKAEDVARLMASEKCELCFTSPPYSDQRTYTGEANLSPTYLCGFIDYAATCSEFVAMNLGLARKHGFIDQYWNEYVSRAGEVGLGIVSWNVWYRTGGFSVGQITSMFPIEHEFVFVFGRRPRKLVPTVVNTNGGARVISTNRDNEGNIGKQKRMKVRELRELGTVFVSPPVNSNAEHPAQFPVAFPAEYIKAFGGSVYDPFLGSGTTLIAAEQLGRRCYGMEISQQYCDVIVQRWENLTGQSAVLDADPS